MSILDSIKRNIKNIFVGSHKGEDIKDEWFKNPLDEMPMANGNNKYHPDPSYNPDIPRPEEEVADWFDESDQIEHEKNYASRHKSTPDFEESAKEIVTMHEKMYQIATAKNNPFAIGGSENINRLGGGSEKVQK